MSPGPAPGCAPSNPTGDNLGARYWPTDRQRPGESIREWIKRLDDVAAVGGWPDG